MHTSYFFYRIQFNFLQNWLSKTSTNSLVEVYKLHCRDEDASLLDSKEELRNVFIKGSLDDVRKNFQVCISFIN